MKKTLFGLLFLMTATFAFAQYNTSVYNQYVDFNEAQYKNETAKAFLKADSILNNKEKLPAKTLTNFYRSLAKLYEDQQQPQKSILYNEKVVAAVPDYYVSHRALGYLYLRDTNVLIKQIKQSNSADQQKYKTQYFNLLKKALPHLEKAEACDHDDETLILIKSLYQKMNDQVGLASLNNRLKTFRANCIDLLTD